MFNVSSENEKKSVYRMIFIWDVMIFTAFVALKEKKERKFILWFEFKKNPVMFKRPGQKMMQ